MKSRTNVRLFFYTVFIRSTDNPIERLLKT